MLLTEYDIIYVTQKAIKGQAIADQLAENPPPDGERMQTLFPDESILCVEEVEEHPDWRFYFDGTANVSGN